MSSRSFRAAAAILVAVLLTSCASGPTSTEYVDSSGQSAELPDVDISSYSDVKAELLADESQFVFPIDRYMTSVTDFDRLDAATSLQVKACMEEKGQPFWVNEVPPSAYLLSADRRYGIWSLSDAAKYGYGLPAEWNETQVHMQQKYESFLSGVSDAWHRAEQECWGSVHRLPWISRGSLPHDGEDRALYLPVELDYIAHHLAREDPGYEEALASWEECLEQNGLTPPDRSEGIQPANTPDELEAQIRVAIIDVTCKQGTRLIEKLSAIEAQYQAALIDQNRAALEASVQKQAELLRQADEIIATHG